MSDPHRAEGPGGVVDEVGQRLRHRRARHLAEEVVHLHRGPAQVERASHRAGREPVDRRPSPGLHLRQHLQPPRQRRLQRPGRHRGQVGLHQHVVDGCGQQRLEKGRGVVVGHERAGVRRQPAEPGHPERRGLLDRPQHLVGPGAGTARPQPGHAPDHAGHTCAGREHLARGQVTDHVEHQPAGLHLVDAGQLRDQRVPRLAGRVLAADQPGEPGGVEPGACQDLPALGRRPGHPPVQLVGGQPGRLAVRARARGEQPSGVRGLDEQCGHRLVHLQQDRGGLEVAHAEAAAAQHPRRAGAPVVEQQLDAAHRLERSTGGDLVHQGGLTRGGGHLGGEVDGLGGRAAAAQHQAHLAGEHDRAAATRHQQPPRQQLLRRGAGVLGQHRVAGAARGGLTALLQDVLEQGAGRRRDLGEPLGDLLGRRGLRGAGPQPAHAGVEPADQQVGHARQRPQPGGGLPHQRQVAQVRECSVGGGRVRVHQRPQLWRCGLAGDDQGIKDGELDPRQLVERTHERSTGGGPRGQLPRVLRGGSGQIRTREEQARQLLVRPRTQLVGQ